MPKIPTWSPTWHARGNVSWPTGFSSSPPQRGGINTNREIMALQNLTTLDLL